MKRINVVLMACLSLMLWWGCGSEPAPEVPVENKKVEAKNAPADRFAPEELRAALPDDALLGLPRLSSSVGTPKMKDGVEISMARRVFRDGKKEVSFEIYDSGTLSSMMDSYVGWLTKAVDMNDNKWIEKRGTYDGFPSYEKYNKKTRSGELHVLPNERFEIIIRGKNIEFEELRDALKKWDVSKSISKLK